MVKYLSLSELIEINKAVGAYSTLLFIRTPPALGSAKDRHKGFIRKAAQLYYDIAL